MPRVQFTQNIQQHVSCPQSDVPGGTLREVLDAVFAANPAARGYVLDDRGGLRAHVVAFIAGRPARDRDTLADPVAADADVFIMQALSGG